MSQDTISTCDICGYRLESLKRKHWTDSIGKAILSFKDVAGCQRVPFQGDCCTKCADTLAVAISALVEQMRAPK